MSIRVAVVQTTSNDLDPDSTVSSALDLVREAGQGGAKLVVLPELWTGLGLTPHRSPQDVADITPDVHRQLGEICEELDIHVVGTTYRSDASGVLRNSAALHRPNGDVSFYDKTHLFDGANRLDLDSVGNESDKVTAGTELVPFETALGPIGITICSDLRFPEPYRLLTLRGARIIVNCSAFLSPRLDHWEFMLRTRAVENQVYVVASGQFGRDAASGVGFVGRSMVVDPWGIVVATAPDRVGMVMSDLDLSLVDDVRRQFPLLQQRRPSMYSDLSADTSAAGGLTLG